jgi:uncharacterized protein (TIGR03067 family)
MRLHSFLILVVVLSLAADAPKDDAVKKELKKVEGTWVLTSGEEKEDKVSDDVLKNTSLTIEGNKHTFKIGDQTIAGTHTVDPTTKPKSIDTAQTEGPFNGKTLLGIYKLEGDKLTLCLALPDKERPTEFTTKSGTGTLLYTFKREKK